MFSESVMFCLVSCAFIKFSLRSSIFAGVLHRCACLFCSFNEGGIKCIMMKLEVNRRLSEVDKSKI